MVVGITGGIGSGKSTVVKMFSEFENIAVYLADDQAKKLMNSSDEIKKELITVFSEKAYEKGVLNRAFIAGIVFKNKDKLSLLNSIVHPYVHQHFQSFVNQNIHADYILYENAILFENRSDFLCDKIITVTAPKSVRIERVLKRDGTTLQAVEARINNQWLEEKKTIQSHYVIENLELSNTLLRVNEIHKKLTNSTR